VYLQSYAGSLADIVSDQVSRLGSQAGSSARKAVHIFGSIGQQTQAVRLLASDLAPADLKGSKRLRHRSLPRLCVYAARRMAISGFFVALAYLLQILKWSAQTLSANRLLVTLLLISGVLNFYYSSRDSWMWWKHRQARNYMSRLGVKSNLVMGRSVWLKDMEGFVVDARPNETWSRDYGAW
jgi:hypothetical protein